MHSNRYVLSFDPGGSVKTWAYALSTVSEGTYSVVEAGFVPVIEDLAKPDFSAHLDFTADLSRRHNLVEGSCDLVAERYIGRGHVSVINEYIPFQLGFWAHLWQGRSLGVVQFIMAAQWKVPAKKWNAQHTFSENSSFENWWEDFFSVMLPQNQGRRKKNKERHIQDACAIGWYYWRWQKKVSCLPRGLTELEAK